MVGARHVPVGGHEKMLQIGGTETAAAQRAQGHIVAIAGTAPALQLILV